MNHDPAPIPTVHALRRRWKPHKERLLAAGGEHATCIRFHRACSWMARVEQIARCQLVHGAATYGGRLNRTALRRCVMMQRLLPALLMVWIDHGAHEDWGPLCHPPMRSVH